VFRDILFVQARVTAAIESAATAVIVMSFIIVVPSCSGG
jgi:hypothetical protein